MRLSYNLILAVFIRYYYPQIKKKKIGQALISVIDPTYSRLDDDNLNREFLIGKINVPEYLYDVKNPIEYKKLCENAKLFKRIFCNETANNKIRYILNKIIENDKELDCTKDLIKNHLSFKNIFSMDFFDFSINLIMYATYYTKHQTKVPVDEEYLAQLHQLGVADVPHLFLEIDKNYLLKYDSYYAEACKDITKIKTILYRQESINFYDIYVAPDLSTSVKYVKDENYREIKGIQTNPNTYLSTFGKCSSIIAPGGFGKSMFLKHLFLCESLDKITDEMKSHLIPIFIEVRSFIKEEANLEEMLFNEVSKYLINLDFGQFKSDLKNGGFLLLFDGLDEIKTSQLQSFFIELNKLADKYPNNNYVTSSRPSEQSECLKKFKIVNLQGFKLERAKKMILKLPNIDEDKKVGFCNLLSEGLYRKHTEITSNPLLLTLMFMVYMIKGKLPTKTSQFYEEAYNVLYYDHDNIKGYKERKYHTKLKRLELSKVISEFSFLTTEGQDYEFTETDIIQILNESSFADTISPDDFIKDLDENLNLIYLEGGKYHFVHRSFQEYFAANHCRLMKNKDYANLPTWFNGLTKNRKFPGAQILYFNTNGLGVFRLLFDMDKERFLTYIVRPTLSTLIEGLSENDYLQYLDKTYEYIEYGFEIAMEPKSHLLKLIMELFANNYFTDMTRYDLPDYEEYRDGEYWLVGNGQTEPIEKINRLDLDTILSQMEDEEAEKYLKENNINPDSPNIFDYKIPVKDIINDKAKFSDLIKILFDDKNQLKQHFIKLNSLK